MGSEPQYAKYPSLDLAQTILSLATSPKSTHDASRKKLQDGIREQKMAPLYRHLAHPIEGVLSTYGKPSSEIAGLQPLSRRGSLVSSNLLPPRQSIISSVLPWDEKLYDELRAENEKELEAIQKEEDEAQDKAGETDVQAARGRRAEFWARVGDKVRAVHPT